MMREIREFWDSLDTGQWALDAYGRFVESLHEDVQRLLAAGDGKESFVVVFGKTQVGKTTLVLDLMDVVPDQLARVSTVLRGNRARGKSATATAMRYRRSADQRWGIRRPGEENIAWHEFDEGMADALARLRKDMEDQVLADACLCDVFLPIDCFDAAQANPLSVQILDLPGDQPANPIEQEHVNAIADYYVPRADLILLVGLSDDLSFLKPENLTLSAIEDWQLMPERFRIITTRSFTPKSVQDLTRRRLSRGEAADEAFYRQHLIAEITGNRFVELNAFASDARRFFPLEFGDSWNGLKTKDPGASAYLEPMLDRLKGQLKRDIAKAAQPLSRVRNALYVRTMIPVLENRKMKELDVQARGVATLLQRLEDRKARLIQARDALARKLERLQQDPLLDMKEPALMRALENRYRLRMPEGPWTSGDAVAGFADKSVKNIGGLICTLQNALLSTWRETRPVHDPEEGGEGAGANEDEARNEGEDAHEYERADDGKADADALVVFWNGLRPDISDQDARACIRDAFRSLQARLDAYWFDGYFSKDNYAADCRYMAYASEHARQALQEISRAAYLKAAKVRLEAHRERNAEARRKASLSISRYEDALHACETRSRGLRGRQGSLVQARQQYQRRMQESLKTSDRFVRLLDDRYTATLKQRRGLIVRKKPGMRSLFALLSIPSLMQTHDYLRIMTGSHEQER